MREGGIGKEGKGKGSEGWKRDINILNHYIKECTIPSKSQHSQWSHPVLTASMQQKEELTVRDESIHSKTSGHATDTLT